MAERKVLWAPWRIDWILAEKSGDGCPLCDEAEGLVVWSDDRVVVRMNRYPYGTGHLLVHPVKHLGDPLELSSETRGAINEVVHHAIGALRRAFDPDGFNVGMNLSPASGAGIPGHLHWHVVPRWDGDTNFLSVLGDVRSIPEHIRSTRDRIADCW